MRRVLTTLALWAAFNAVFPLAEAHGQAASEPNRDWSQCRQSNGGDGYVCPWGKQSNLPGGSAKPTSGRSSSGSAQPAPRVAYRNVVTVGPDGQRCFYRRAIPIPDGAPIAPGTDFGNDFGNITATYPPCPAQPSEAAEGSDPSVLAIEGWEAVDLPKPQPYIAPGWAITGKYAYLETRGQLTHTFTTDTPIGGLRIESRGAYYVDWGDGTTTGPHSAEGGPWPDGTITHTYIDVGTYDVVVTERWTANWNLGPASGRLTGQQTVGRIDGFRVEQVQAVVRSE